MLIAIENAIAAKLATIQNYYLVLKPLQRSRAVGDFYGTGIEIWATFEAGFFMFSWAKKKF